MKLVITIKIYNHLCLPNSFPTDLEKKYTFPTKNNNYTCQHGATLTSLNIFIIHINATKRQPTNNTHSSTATMQIPQNRIIFKKYRK